MLVVLILVAVALGPLWGSRLGAPRAYLVTASGWVAAMVIVVAGAAATKTRADDPDLGFWIFNTVLLGVALALTMVGARRRAARIAR